MPPQTHPLTTLLHSLRLSPLSHKPSSLLPPFTTLLPQRNFTTTPSNLAGGRPGQKQKKTNADQRIALIRYHLQHPKTPRPLRLSRMRALRHWTIHRAWMLVRRKRIEGERGELYRYVSLTCVFIVLVGFVGSGGGRRLWGVL